MHSHTLDRWTHEHVFLGSHHAQNERRTWLVVALTTAMMVGEIVGGSIFGSMALLADGWHMSTHAVAIGIAALAYRFARHHARNPRFAFGTGKFGDLAAFASAVVLSLVAVEIAYESAVRFVHPVSIVYREALLIAVLGLIVNLVCAWLLRDDHHHHHDHHHHEDHAHHHGHRDNNLRAAYVHVLTDAATSVLAIAALLMAKYSQWVWMDPVVGVVGALVILGWAYGLLRDSSAVLLDAVPEAGAKDAIRRVLETEGDRITDLHLWQVGPGHHAAVVSIVSDHPLAPAAYKERLSGLSGLSHVTVEVEACPQASH